MGHTEIVSNNMTGDSENTILRYAQPEYHHKETSNSPILGGILENHGFKICKNFKVTNTKGRWGNCSTWKGTKGIQPPNAKCDPSVTKAIPEQVLELGQGPESKPLPEATFQINHIGIYGVFFKAPTPSGSNM